MGTNATMLYRVQVAFPITESAFIERTPTLHWLYFFFFSSSSLNLTYYYDGPSRPEPFVSVLLVAFHYAYTVLAGQALL
jgi:hypothetical protein